MPLHYFFPEIKLAIISHYHVLNEVPNNYILEMAENIFLEIDVVSYLESGNATEVEVNDFKGVR